MKLQVGERPAMGPGSSYPLKPCTNPPTKTVGETCSPPRRGFGK